MSTDQFAERIAAIRVRFASKLATKIEDTDAALPHLAGAGAEVVDAVATIYRRIHDLCGVGPTVGFVETGQAARNIDTILIGPFRAARGLTDDEVARLKAGLDALRAAALIDIQSTDTVRE
jgi:hypothetical protein